MVLSPLLLRVDPRAIEVDRKLLPFIGSLSSLSIFLFNHMIPFDFDHFFQNVSFASLLILLLFHWGDATFFFHPTIGRLGMWVANVALTLLLLGRWVTAGHFPLSNLYESLLFLSWSFTALHLLLERSSDLPFLGLLTTPMALFTNAFATFTLPPEMQRATGLVPALQSNWLMMHVTIMIVSYAALMVGCLLSMAFLIVQFRESHRGPASPLAKAKSEEKARRMDPASAMASISTPDSSVSSLLASENGTMLLRSARLEEREASSIKQSSQPALAIRLDNLSYRTLGLGFPLLTVGILSGAVWANEAWGSYWSWDPKETWALITWLVFAIYFHTRFTKNWSGTKPAVIATMGFFVLWICYLGVNLLGTGLHSYGWFQ